MSNPNVPVEELERRRLLAASIDDRVLIVDGTGGDDVISITASGGGNIVVTINGDDDVFDDLDFDTIEVNAGGGDDRVSMGEGLTAPATLRGGAGDDTLQPSNSGREYLAGGDGNDTVEYVNATSSPYSRYFVGYYEPDDTSPTPYVFITIRFVNDDRASDDVERFVGVTAHNQFDIQRRIDAIPLGKELTLQGGDLGNGFAGADGLRVTMIGGDQSDSFRVTEDADETILAGDGNDFIGFHGTGRPNSLSGGAGTDLINLFQSDGTGTVDLRLSPDVEDVVGIKPGQTVIGNGLGNRLDARYGTAGSVTLIGGDGNDTLDGNQGSAGDSLDGGDGDDVIRGTPGDDSIDGSAGDDVITGLAGDDSIDGSAGDDFITGQGGDDTLDGGAGSADTVLGGGGNDVVQNAEVDTPQFQLDNGTFRYEGFDGPDQVSIWSDGSNLVVWIDEDLHTFDLDDVTAIAMNGNGGDDVLKVKRGLAIPATLDGGDGDDRLEGGAADDVLLDGAGRDYLEGNGGDDYFTSSRGSPDTLKGSGGVDTVDYSDRTANLRITLLRGFNDDGEVGEFDYVGEDFEIVLSGSGDDRIIGSVSTDQLYGGEGDDTIAGGERDDSIYGGGGHDKLVGDAGDDHLEGGAGNDRLYGLDGHDTIFALAGNDRIFTANDNEEDFVIGGHNQDAGLFDAFDVHESVEQLL